MWWVILIIFATIILYFLIWPVPIDPIAWGSPSNTGYIGKLSSNNRLKALNFFSIGHNHWPEDIAIDAKGFIYTSTHAGNIVRLQPNGSNPENWANTGGRPLGIEFDHEGSLIVADAYRGLLSITPGGEIIELATMADGVPIRYANNLDVALDGKIYFTDSSTKFGAEEWGGIYEASLLDIIEHGAHGRLLVYDPSSGEVKTLLKGLNFPNGVAVSHDQTFILVNETGSYKIIRYWIDDLKRGQVEVFINELPSFPDNISRGLCGRFWVALISPRNPVIDKLAENPFMRKVVQRLPLFLRPKAVSYGHIIAIDGEGNILEDLQDPHGKYPMNTSVIETKDYLYIGSLVAPFLARLSKKRSSLLL